MSDDVPGQPDVSTDERRDEDPDALVAVADAGAFTRTFPWVFGGIAWGHAQDLNSDNDACRVFASVPGWLQDVQHAENWEEREEEGGES